jgi:hypothetical protein
VINHVAYCEGRKVATVHLKLVNRFGSKKRWEIIWHNRQDARERIPDLTQAKIWLHGLLRGKEVEWRKEKAE